MLSIALPVADAWNVWWSQYGNPVDGFVELKASLDAAKRFGRAPERERRRDRLRVRATPVGSGRVMASSRARHRAGHPNAGRRRRPPRARREQGRTQKRVDIRHVEVYRIDLVNRFVPICRPSLGSVTWPAANVSSTTASLVLNGKDDAISPETRERVRRAAEELGYRPNAVAKSLRRRVTHTIAFVSDEIVTTPYAGAMIQGAQDVAHEHGYMLLLANTNNDAELEEQLIGALLDRQVDAAVYATMYHRIVDVPASLRSTPLVLLDARPPSGDAMSWVVPDEVARGPRRRRTPRLAAVTAASATSTRPASASPRSSDATPTAPHSPNTVSQSRPSSR